MENKILKIITPVIFIFSLSACLRGGNEDLSSKNTKHEHIYSSNENYPSKYPTCEDYGEEILVCEECGDLKSTKIDPLGHYMQLIEETESTCVYQGNEKYQCSRCGITNYESKPLKEHNYEHYVIEPTCTDEGYENMYVLNAVIPIKIQL